MKTIITPAYVFTPSAHTLDLSSVASFSIKNLYAVLNQTTGAIIYAAGTAGMGYTSLSGSVLTLAVSMVGMNSSDQLMIVYDDGSSMANLLGGSSVIGYTGSLNFGPIVASPMLTTTSVYQLGYSVGGIITLPAVFRTTTQPSATLSQFMIRFVSQMTAVQVFLFSKTPSTSTISDHSVVTFSTTDLNYLAYQPFTLAPTGGIISSAGYYGYQALALPVENQDSPITENLYAVVVAAGTSPILTQYDLTVSISGVQD